MLSRYIRSHLADSGFLAGKSVAFLTDRKFEATVWLLLSRSHRKSRSNSLATAHMLKHLAL